MPNPFLPNPWEYVVEPIYPNGKYLYQDDRRFYVSMNDDKQFNFFVELKGNHSLNDIPALKSIKIDIVHLNNSTRLVCTLEENEILDKFTWVAMDLAIHCASFDDHLVLDECKEKLLEWSLFLRPDRRGLTRSEKIGFWGELYALTEFIIPKYKHEQAINFWIGPDGKKQDFAMNEIAIEVKTTESFESSQIKISSLDQLHQITPHLYLLHLLMNKSDNQDGFSIDEMYRAVLDEISNDATLSLNFVNKTRQLYQKATNEDLNEKYLFLESHVYEVKDNFPCITSEVVPGIDKANYSIRTSTIKSFLLDQDIRDLI